MSHRNSDARGRSSSRQLRATYSPPAARARLAMQLLATRALSHIICKSPARRGELKVGVEASAATLTITATATATTTYIDLAYRTATCSRDQRCG